MHAIPRRREREKAQKEDFFCGERDASLRNRASSSGQRGLKAHERDNVISLSCISRSQSSPDSRFPKMNNNFLYVVDGVILTVVSVFGIIGTLMSLGVLLKQRWRKTRSSDHFSQFLSALAVFDTTFLITALLNSGLPHLSAG